MKPDTAKSKTWCVVRFLISHLTYQDLSGELREFKLNHNSLHQSKCAQTLLSFPLFFSLSCSHMSFSFHNPNLSEEIIFETEKSFWMEVELLLAANQSSDLSQVELWEIQLQHCEWLPSNQWQHYWFWRSFCSSRFPLCNKQHVTFNMHAARERKTLKITASDV